MSYCKDFKGIVFCGVLVTVEPPNVDTYETYRKSVLIREGVLIRESIGTEQSVPIKQGVLIFQGVHTIGGGFHSIGDQVLSS